jgi:hypothetical protein
MCSQGYVIAVRGDCPAAHVMRTSNLAHGVSIYLVAPESGSSGGSKHVDVKIFQSVVYQITSEGGGVYDSSMYGYHTKAPRASVVLGRKNCSISLHKFRVEDDVDNIYRAIVVSNYHTPSSEALYALAQKPGVTVEQVYNNKLYTTCVQQNALARDAIASIVAERLGVRLRGANYRGTLLAGDPENLGTSQQEVTGSRPYLSQESNVLERTFRGGVPAFLYYDHCFYLKHQQVLVGMGRHEGYELLGYDHASATGAKAVEQRPQALDERTLYAFPRGTRSGALRVHCVCFEARMRTWYRMQSLC